MKKTLLPAKRSTIGLGIVLAVLLAGCGGGYVNGSGYDGYYGGPDNDLYLFGGYDDRGRDVHAYSHRGSESRGAAHAGGGAHGAHGGHGGGGGGHGGGGHGGR